MSIFGGKTDNLSEMLKRCLSTDGSLDNGGFAHGSCSKVLKNMFLITLLLHPLPHTFWIITALT